MTAATNESRGEPLRLSLEAIAERIGATLAAEGDAGQIVSGLAEPADATSDHLSFLTDARRLNEVQQSHAGAFVVSRKWDQLVAPQLICDDPRRALAMLLKLFHPRGPTDTEGVDPRAAVAPDASLASTVAVGPFAYIGHEARIGEQTRVAPLAFVGDRAIVGERCVIGPGAVLCDGCSISDDVIVGPGAVVGHDGFGFYRDEESWRPVPSIGNVHVGTAAEIGANACIDRATLGTTAVGSGAKLDNLVQVGHNAQVGANALLCAQVGLAGSVEIGADAVLAGQVGVADHLRVGEGARVGAKGGVAQDVPDGQTVSGYPAFEHRSWLRASALLPALGELVREVRSLRREVDELKKHGDKQQRQGD